MSRHDRFTVVPTTNNTAWEIIDVEQESIDGGTNNEILATFYQEDFAESYAYWLNGLYAGKFSKEKTAPIVPFHDKNTEWDTKLLTPRSHDGGN